MIQFDTTKSLQELENKDWGEPHFDSQLVQECHRLRRVPLKDFTTEDLRIMIGQNIGLDYLIHLAIEKLKQNPLVEGNFYAGDLLVNVLRSDPDFWLKHSDMKTEVAQITGEAFEIHSITKIEFETIRDAYNLFLRASTTLR
jgi:CDI immunity proteins